MESKLLNTIEAAEYLRISRRTVYRLIDKGDIPYVLIGAQKMILVKDLEKYINKNRVTGEKNGNGDKRKNAITAV
jgi:excisionase family DNA binding protein